MAPKPNRVCVVKFRWAQKPTLVDTRAAVRDQNQRSTVGDFLKEELVAPTKLVQMDHAIHLLMSTPLAKFFPATTRPSRMILSDM